MLVGLYLALGPKLRLSEWTVTRDNNTALEEALQWKTGTLHLSRTYYEDALFDGKPYNVVGLSFVILSVVATTVTAWTYGDPAQFHPAFYVLLVAVPLPIVGFWAFRTVVKSSAWAAVITAHLIAGTGLAATLALCRVGSIYHINHVLAVTGLLILGADLLGARRIWPAAIGLCLAVWSRQPTCFYALPLIWIAYRTDSARASIARANSSPQNHQTMVPEASRRSNRRIVFALAGIALAAAVPMTLNTLKFGNPFDTGYPRLYEGRQDWISTRAQQCFMGPRYIPEHAKAMNVAFPGWDIRKGTLYADTGDTNGASIWLTSPLLLGLFLTVRRWWPDPHGRLLVLSTLPVMAVLMCYHTTGATNAGFYRYALDYIPIWLLVFAPFTKGRRGRPLTLACLAYSALYFNLIP